MTDHVYKKIELTGTSKKSMEDAVNNAVKKAATTVHELRWFEVIDTRGTITNGEVAQWQVTVSLGFVIED